MADVLVVGGSVADGRVKDLEVQLHGLGERTLDRDTAVAWMKDGHSFVPVHKGSRGPALLLLEVGDELFIRHQADGEASDALPPLG